MFSKMTRLENLLAPVPGARVGKNQTAAPRNRFKGLDLELGGPQRDGMRSPVNTSCPRTTPGTST
jgi:hypothetical protein